jgi:DNA ligase (NAD+)
MASFQTLYPVYKEIAQYLHDDPERALEMSLEQLKPIIELSQGAPNVLLDMGTLDRVKTIYNNRTTSASSPGPAFKVTPIKLKVKAKAKAKVQAKAKAKAKVQVQAKVSVAEPTAQPKNPKIKIKAMVRKVPVSSIQDTIGLLNNDHQKALDMSQPFLEKLLKWSDLAYLEGKEHILQDKVYDYVKRIYNQRQLKTNDKKLTMASISSKTGVGVDADADSDADSDSDAMDKLEIKRLLERYEELQLQLPRLELPKRERNAKLPFVLRSLDNLFMGEGDVSAWAHKSTGQTYVVSTKMDGTSALYHRGRLYTRGDAVMGRDISHVIPYLNLPDIPDDIAVRGEIVIAKKLFDTKYKGQKGTHGGHRRVNRNSVSGALGSINHIDPVFLADLTFAAYEIINEANPQASPHNQFQALKEAGFETAYNTEMKTVDDESLSTLYHELLSDYIFEIDGLVVHVNRPYVRELSKNPEYVKAFKEALDCDTAVTEILDIEWNPSQYGYLIPTVIYTPVVICGVTMGRATAHHAKDVVKLGLGPGAKIEVIYWGKVNPRINKVLEPVEPYLPQVPYKWLNETHVVIDKDALDGEDLDLLKTVQVKRIHSFLVKIGAKGMGETTVEKIYDEGHTSVADFINLHVEDVAFLGATASKNVIKAIRNSLESITVPVLMAGSKVFGKGLGAKKFTKVLNAHPSFASERLSSAQYVALFKSVEGFAQKSAELAAEGMDEFWTFVEQEIPSDIYEIIIDNTIAALDDKEAGGHVEIEGKQICLTGFRNRDISDFITKNGGTLQSGCNTHTDILLRSTSSYTNKKTEYAEDRGITIMDQDEFKEKFF